jgi:hypothetical protein
VSAGTDVVEERHSTGRPSHDRVDASSLVPLALLVAGWFALLPTFSAYLTPDGVSYLSVAQHLADGRVGAALNGYWSPLWSWLAAPFLAVGVPPLLTARIVGLLSAVLVLLALDRLLRACGASSGARLVTSVGVVPFALQGAITWMSPDLLVAAFLLLFAERLLAWRWLASTRAAAATGAIAGVAYLAKLYALPVVVVVTLATLTVAWWRHRHTDDGIGGTDLLARSGALVAGLLLVVGAWGVALTASYGTPTLGTSASVNVGVLVPGASVSPILGEGLFAPPHEGSTSAWEDPSRLDVDAPEAPNATDDAGRADDAGAGDAGEDHGIARLLALTGNLGDNLELTWEFVRELWVVVALIVVGAALALSGGGPPSRGQALALLGIAAVWTGGLQLLVAHARYLWPVPLLLAPLAAYVFDRARPPAVAYVVGLALLAGWTPFALAELDEHSPHGRSGRVLAAGLEDLGVEPGDAVAADTVWNAGVTACFHVGCRFHGMLDEPGDEQRTLEELRDHDVEWVLAWRELPAGVHGRVVGTVDTGGAGTVEVHHLTADRSSS